MYEHFVITICKKKVITSIFAIIICRGKKIIGMEKYFKTEKKKFLS